MFSEQGFWSISDRINKCPAAHWIHRDGFFFPSFLLLDAEKKKNRSEYRLPRIAFRNNSKEDENLENVSPEMFFFYYFFWQVGNGWELEKQIGF